MKTCSKCRQSLPLESFHLDRNSRRSAGRYAYCKDCRRAYYGNTKRTPREPRPCAFCAVVFLPRPGQVKTNLTGTFFCSAEHQALFKQQNAVTWYLGYRKYILERDGQRCVLCGDSRIVHVHHIITRGAGGSDEYTNLCTLCQNCHSNKAHGPEGSLYRERLLKYTAPFVRPDFWDRVMERSRRDRKRISAAIRWGKRAYREKLKKDGRYVEYLARENQKRRERQRTKKTVKKNLCKNCKIRNAVYPPFCIVCK